MHSRVQLALAVTLTSLMFAAAQASVSCYSEVSVAQDSSSDSAVSRVFCGVAKNSADVRPSPMVCADSVEKIAELMKEAAQKTIATDKICYLRFLSSKKCSKLKFDDEFWKNVLQFEAGVKLRLHKSVSLIFGVTEKLEIYGSMIDSLNPEVFDGVGESQKEKLKVFSISSTSLTSLDLSLLARLQLETLALTGNRQLRRLLNSKQAKLDSPTELVLAKNHQDLLNCTNFKALPPSIRRLVILPVASESLSTACGLCNLPEKTKSVVVPATYSNLPFHPKVAKEAKEPYLFFMSSPLQDCDTPNLIMPVNTFNASQATAAGCDACQCSVQGTVRPQPEPKAENPEVKTSLDGGKGGRVAVGSLIHCTVAAVVVCLAALLP